MAGELGVAKFAADTLLKLFGLREQRKQDVAELFAEIADTLSQFGPAFRAGNHEQLIRLSAATEVLAAKLPDVTKGILSAEDVKKYAQKLAEASQDKATLAQGATPGQQSMLDNISRAAGVFLGLSMSLKATANRLG
jgi:hypothetical protein